VANSVANGLEKPQSAGNDAAHHGAASNAMLDGAKAAELDAHDQEITAKEPEMENTRVYIDSQGRKHLVHIRHRTAHDKQKDEEAVTIFFFLVSFMLGSQLLLFYWRKNHVRSISFRAYVRTQMCETTIPLSHRS
jgi:hypothetical protein